MKNRGLGRGLEELFGEVAANTEGGANSVRYVSILALQPNKHQPRKRFDESKLYELADSIKRNGVIQPIIVRELGNGNYGIVAGERRFRASQMAGFDTIPVIVSDIAEDQALEVAIIENVQREDLNIMEEAESYLKLINEFGYTQEELATIIGKSRSHIANILRLNSLPQPVKELLAKRTLTMGHAKMLVGHDAAEEMAEMIVGRGLNSRQAEQLVKNWGDRDRHRNQKRSDADDDLEHFLAMLSREFGIRISIENKAGGAGSINFHFGSLEELDSIITQLTSRLNNIIARLS